MKTIAIYHNKGGMGKTTTTINLGAAINRKGYNVLIIDLDSNADLTYATGLLKHENIEDNNIFHILFYPKSYYIPEIVLKGSFTYPEIDVIPSCEHISMEYLYQLSLDLPSRSLLNKLTLVKNVYDIVLIDTGTSDLLAKTALMTCDYLIIPSDLKPFSNKSLKMVKSLIDETLEYRLCRNQQPINIIGILPCKILTNTSYTSITFPKQEKPYNNTCGIFIKETFLENKVNVGDNYGFSILKNTISMKEDLSRSINNFKYYKDFKIHNPKSIFDFNPNSISAIEFENLANEILENIFENSD